MKIRYIIIVVLGVILYTIGLLGVSRVISDNPEKGKEKFGSAITNLILRTGELPRNIKSLFAKPDFYISDTLIKDGFTYYTNNTTTYSKLLISYKTAEFDQKIQLLDIETGALIKEWSPNSKLISKLSYNEDNPGTFEKGADLHYSHPVLLKDSSVVFNTNYSLVKINKENKLEWVNNSIWAHHSIELDANGEIYISGRNFLSGQYDFLPRNTEEYTSALQDDAIMKIDPSTGKILYNKSVIEVLVQNGYESMLHTGGQLSFDPVHLNDVQPALSTTEYWEQEDLLISCRSLSAVFLFRPSTNKILWLRQGPWRGQHDPNFYGDRWVTVFGNDILVDYPSRKIFKNGHHLLKGHNEIYVYDLEKDTITTPFTRLLKKENVKTATQGNCEILPNGDIFIEETSYGRIIIGDSINKKVEFARRLDPETITVLNWSRIIY